MANSTNNTVVHGVEITVEFCKKYWDMTPGQATEYLYNALGTSLNELCGGNHGDKPNPNKAKHLEAIRKARDIEKAIPAVWVPMDGVEVGDGVTVPGYSDRSAYTVLKRTAKSVTIQRDIATLLNKDELEFIPGGFSAHCTNQHIQKYSYEADPNGEIVTLRRRKNGTYGAPGADNRSTAYPGRSEFYDYNF